LPSSIYPNIKTVCKEIAVKTIDIANAIPSEMIISGSRYSDRASEIKDLKFSGRVYIYYQAYLSEEDIDELERYYKEKGLDPVFRGSDYQTYKWLWDKGGSD
jgi:hypothetical protein